MFVEGLHLYRMIVMVYGIEKDLKKLYLFIGWGNVTEILEEKHTKYSIYCFYWFMGTEIK